MEKPSQAYNRIFTALRFYGALVGCDIFQKNYRINALTIMAAVLIIAYYICSFRTVVQTYQEDWKIILEALCLAFSVLQGAVKLLSVLVQKDLTIRTSYLIEDLYTDYETRGKSYVVALHKSCARIQWIRKIVLLFYFLTGSGLVLIPFVFQLFTGQRYLVMQFYFPGLDVKTNSGYWITTALHIPFIYSATIGLYASDLLTINLFMQSFMFADIFKIKVAELNELVKDENQSVGRNKVKELLVDIVNWHQLYSNYTKTCNDMFLWVITVMVTTAGVSCLFSLFIILTGNWPGAYPYLIIAIYTLYFYCILGTKIEVCNDEFCFSIYNLSWYELKVPEQKVVRLMLMKSQNPQTLRVANMFPLSVNTALQITKFCYSVFMMMLRVLLGYE